MDEAKKKSGVEWASIQRGSRKSRHKEEKFVTARVRYVMGRFRRKSKGRQDTCPWATKPITVRGIIWSSCCDARSVHWWHWYHCQPTVVAGEFRYRYHSVASGNCCHHERSYGVVSGAKRTFPLESRWL